MQRLLTEEEYANLEQAGEKAKKELRETLQDLCTRVANNEPTDWGWTKGDPLKPWKCVRTEEQEWYCDSCPVQDVCPADKQWSK